MKTKWLFALWLLVQVLLIALLFHQPHQEQYYLRTPIYDESADASKQIAESLIVAKREHKLVLLQFGANWCIWCHILYHLFETDRAVHEQLQSDYILLLVDVNNGHNQATVEKYGEPTQFGLPALVLIESSGRQLATQSGADFAGNDGYNPEKVLAFLNKWSKKVPQ